RTPTRKRAARSPAYVRGPVCHNRLRSMRRGAFFLPLAGLLLLGRGLRVALLAGPLGELDGDEAVVGLMARHIAFLGERPVLYYGQPYLGSLEAFPAAPLLVVFASTTFVL